MEVGGENHLWSLPLAGRGTPVTANGRLFTLGYEGEGVDLEECLVCLDEATGEKLWELRYRDFLSDTVYVYDYNGVAGDNFQVYYDQQRADFVVPQSSGNLVGSPSSGLTNAQNWSQHGIAIACAVAPGDATTRARIRGLVRRF